jgi:SAM-dependent methyltransferase
MTDQLPDYARRLDLLHRALRAEFAEIIASADLRGKRVVDAGCGDGFFSELLLEAGAAGVIALDASPEFLDAAKQRLSSLARDDVVEYVIGDVNDLPFDDGSIDAILSVHSMQSYDDLGAVLAEFRRVLRPGGTLAVLESDTIHSVMLPWPPRLELAVREAERRGLGDVDDRRGAYIPRYARRLFDEAGFRHFQRRHTLVFREGPLPELEQEYVRLYLGMLVEQTRSRLDSALVADIEKFSASFQTGEETGWMASLQVLFTAVA